MSLGATSPLGATRFVALRRDVSIRARALSLTVLYVAYVLAGGLGQGLAIVPGIEVTFWPPAGILLCALLLQPRSRWGWCVLVAGAAELTCNAIWFHNPVLPALYYFGANALESLTATCLIRAACPGPFRLATLREVGALVVLGAGVAPLVGATLIAGADAWIGKHAFWTAWPLVWLGDGTGLLVSAPLGIVTVETWRARARIPGREAAEAALVGGLIFTVCFLALVGVLPTIYMTIPLVVWAAARFQLRGAAVAMALITITLAAFSLAQRTPISSLHLAHDQVITQQLFLAISAASALLAAALSEQHARTSRALTAANRDLRARMDELHESHGRLRVAERMAVLGSLAAGLGHDLGNLLLPIRMRLEDIERSPDLAPELREAAASIRRSHEYLRNLAGGLRSLSLDPERATQGAPSTNLDAWWEEARALMRCVLPRNVHLHALGFGSQARVAIPAPALTQAVFNLVQNAANVLRDRPRGAVWIEAQVRAHALLLIVRDNGPGMSEEVRARCMEPFFTTREDGRGTGLGLTIVQSVLERYSCRVRVESAPDQGATFTLELPLAPDRGPRGLRAAVSVRDARTRAYIRHILADGGITLLEPEATVPDVDVWVVDDSVHDDLVARFGETDPDRRAVRLGKRGRTQATCVPELRPEAIRAALSTVLRPRE